MKKNIGIYLTNTDSEVFMKTLYGSINERLPDIKTELVYGQETIYGSRTTIIFDYSPENLLLITSLMSPELKDALSISPL